MAAADGTIPPASRRNRDDAARCGADTGPGHPGRRAAAALGGLGCHSAGAAAGAASSATTASVVMRSSTSSLTLGA